MAKSLRSKFKRKMRTLKREKNAGKMDKMLATVVAKMTEHEGGQDAVMREEVSSTVDKMESGGKSSLNLKTMKKADGNYPSWMSAKKKRELRGELISPQPGERSSRGGQSTPPSSPKEEGRTD
ncbi:hypothetical protein PRIPAC_82140 [Pristionchus pacificus]|uniref:Uncharacterized protein n=1 Tax=Pristionchus pacificus TaxID=54126 RepID=A0A2A6BYK9_PRIPA|nr:hypothetical protein PRIPAC_82140 [Pristionchus pacificus]|eukprot:PDM70990.1 hypothetical protein PRIPAC_44386 [Pristionchus pacificus]